MTTFIIYMLICYRNYGEKYVKFRKKAIEILGNTGDRRAVEPLSLALKDESEYVREAAAKALGKIGDKRAAEAIIS
ncbi:MAG: HEAT repeat domain-containing protein, partial [Methanobacterium sp.]